MSAQVAVDGLTVRFPGAARPALDGLSVSARSGSLVALLGPSGCGKTTTLRAVAGLVRPDAGDVRLDGTSVLGEPPERRPVAMVFQSPLLLPHLSVVENVGFGLKVRGVGRAERRARVGEVLDLVRLPGLDRRRPAELSGGQQQRVSLARALVVRPQVLLLDEPLAALDAPLREQLRTLLREVQQETGVTALLVTHDQAEAVGLADEVALVLDGRVVQQAPPRQLYERPAAAAVARFVGSPVLVTGSVGGSGRRLRHSSALGDVPLADDVPVTSGPALLVVRPEALEVEPAPERATPGDVDLSGTTPESRLAARLPGRVVAATFLGESVRLRVEVRGVLELDALVPPVRRVAVGDAVVVRLPRAAAWVVPPDAPAGAGTSGAVSPR